MTQQVVKCLKEQSANAWQITQILVITRFSIKLPAHLPWQPPQKTYNTLKTEAGEGKRQESFTAGLAECQGQAQL